MTIHAESSKGETFVESIPQNLAVAQFQDIHDTRRKMENARYTPQCVRRLFAMTYKTLKFM